MDFNVIIDYLTDGIKLQQKTSNSNVIASLVQELGRAYQGRWDVYWWTAAVWPDVLPDATHDLCVMVGTEPRLAGR